MGNYLEKIFYYLLQSKIICLIPIASSEQYKVQRSSEFELSQILWLVMDDPKSDDGLGKLPAAYILEFFTVSKTEEDKLCTFFKLLN